MFNTALWILCLITASALVIFCLLRYFQSKKPSISPYAVRFDDREIVVSYQGKKSESVLWNDLIVVGIRIENQGFLDVPCWILAGTYGRGCIYHSDAVGNELLLQEMQSRLPDFDSLAVIQAMGMSAGSITVWTKSDEGKN